MSEPVAVLFDVDGTLVSSGGAGTEAWRWSFLTHFGEPVDVGEHTPPGTTDPVVARRSFLGAFGYEPSARDVARLISGYLQRLPREVERSTKYRVLPGVEGTLNRLCDEGYLLGLTTGLLEGAAHAKLARGGLNGFFCVGGYGSDAADRGQLTRRAIERVGAVLGGSLDPRVVLVVGDTPQDIAAAQAAGAVAIGVATGSYDRGRLREAGAEATLETLDELDLARL